jgi:hypothetical protein
MKKGIKVFWFFFSKKNTASFSAEKEAKRLLFLCSLAIVTVAQAQPVPSPHISPPDTWIKKDQGTIRVLNKLDSTVQTISLHVGETVKLQSLSITLTGCAARPADLPADSTAHLKVVDSRSDGPSFDAWILHREPAINMFEHPVYDIQLVSCS